MTIVYLGIQQFIHPGPLAHYSRRDLLLHTVYGLCDTQGMICGDIINGLLMNCISPRQTNMRPILSQVLTFYFDRIYPSAGTFSFNAAIRAT